MLIQGKTLRAVAATWMCAMAGQWVVAAGHAPAGPSLPADATDTLRWVIQTSDNERRPFAIVAKKDAMVFVFDATGRLVGATPALLGQAPGDRAVASAGAGISVGVGEPARLPAAQRTTPAGRFESEPGHNEKGEAIIWIDYDAALAIHRLRPGPARERRAQRLASATPADNRATLGCVVVAVDFYEKVIGPTLGRSRGVVYVLPETMPAREMFNAERLSLLTR